ncbi:hypothetical protein [Microbacterium pumilum]
MTDAIDFCPARAPLFALAAGILALSACAPMAGGESESGDSGASPISTPIGPGRARATPRRIERARWMTSWMTCARFSPPRRSRLRICSSGRPAAGFDVYHYAGRHPDEVVGLVMDDVPSPQADIPASKVPPWDSPDNQEHMDYVLIEHQLAVDRLPIPAIPLTVLWATNGQSATQDDQDLWLEGSSDPQTVAVESGHDIVHGNPAAVADAIAGMLASMRG